MWYGAKSAESRFKCCIVNYGTGQADSVRQILQFSVKDGQCCEGVSCLHNACQHLAKDNMICCQERAMWLDGTELTAPAERKMGVSCGKIRRL
ncbi:hypothetical protein RRG08_040631 [Elysia crispata]|uniref:Uncharacterized protein n=1 Tax=Elysia crispata TaxID=231223 RepID=A0AAE1B359_9GAST|nr:hypothetical protein RRG08_040631 [Elysia crispata]